MRRYCVDCQRKLDPDTPGNSCGSHSFELVVDWDDPHVIRTGPISFLLLPHEHACSGYANTGCVDPDCDRRAQPLSDEWQEVGYMTEDGIG